MSERRIALVTGSNRGIGHAIAEGLSAQGFHVIVASRELAAATATADALRSAGGSAEPLALDVKDAPSVRRAAELVAARHPRLDVLVNNAGIMVGHADTILTASEDDLNASLATNAFGPLAVVKAFRPLLGRSSAARVVNVSSTVSSHADIMDAASPYAGLESASYRLSKSVLNAVTTLLARTLRAEGVLVNAMCPGWVRTDMGGADAPKSAREGADTALWLATLPADGPTGGFFSDRKPISW